MQRVCVAVVCLAISAQAQPLGPAASAQRKLDLLRDHKVARGSILTFTPAEINAWARAKITTVIPSGVRNPYFAPGTDVATATALIDFLKIRSSNGVDSSWAMSKLLEGERPVKVLVRVASSGGLCTVFLTRVEIGSAVISGTVLEFLIERFLQPLYPNAKINEPFELADGIERVDVRPNGIRVTMKR